MLMCMAKGKKATAGTGKDKAAAAMEELLGADNLSSEAVSVLYVAATAVLRSWIMV